MECTKGELKWQGVGNRCELFTDDAWIGELYVGYGMKNIEEMEANAKELVRRWNAFEKDGLLDELVEAFKELTATFVGLPEGSIGGQAMKKAEAAIRRYNE